MLGLFEHHHEFKDFTPKVALSGEGHDKVIVYVINYSCSSCQYTVYTMQNYFLHVKCPVKHFPIQ